MTAGNSSVIGTVCSSIGTRVLEGPGIGMGEGKGEVEGAGPCTTIQAS